MGRVIMVVLPLFLLCQCGDALASEIYEGVSVVNGTETDPCFVQIERDEDNAIRDITVTGEGSEGSYLNSKPVHTTINIREEPMVEGWEGYTSFARLPSLAHFGYTRVALLKRWGNFDNPLPGLMEARYIVEKGDFSEVIASDRIAILTEVAAFSRSKIHCRALTLKP